MLGCRLREVRKERGEEGKRGGRRWEDKREGHGERDRAKKTGEEASKERREEVGEKDKEGRMALQKRSTMGRLNDKRREGTIFGDEGKWFSEETRRISGNSSPLNQD